MEKYGFVYLWKDKKKSKYYIGCRWGNVNDNYICSSKTMNKAYKERPQDFKRRILKTNITTRRQTLVEEYRYLSMIKKEELGSKYYNLHNHHFNHWTILNNTLSIGKKISLAHQNYPGGWSSWSKNKVVTKESREKMRKAKLGKTSNFKGKTLSEEAKIKISLAKKGSVPWNKKICNESVNTF